MDLRSARTKKNIQDAFLTLRKSKPLEKITVKELSDFAMINKSTFYRYYEDVYKLSDEIENTVIEKCLGDCTDFKNKSSDSIVTDMTQNFIKNFDVFNVVFSNGRIDIAIDKFHQKFMDAMITSHPEIADDLEKRVMITSVIYGNFKAYTIYQHEDNAALIKALQKLSDILKSSITETD